MGRSTHALVALCVIVASWAVLVAPLGAASFFNGFETDADGWEVFGGNFNATRVASGSNGVTSKTGSFHAEAGQFDLNNDGGSAATDWGGVVLTFPAGGYTTSVEIYLDVSLGGPGTDVRFDWSSAIGDGTGAHRRDFVFNAGTDATGFVISAGNNAGRIDSFPSNPAQDPIQITTTGWYTFEHVFYDLGGGLLACDMSIIDDTDTVVKTWTLTGAGDIIGLTVGGSQYGWFASNEFSFLAFDDSRKTEGAPATTTTTVTTTTTTTTTTVPPPTTTTTTLPPAACGDTFPLCDGACPPGQICLVAGLACACQAVTTTTTTTVTTTTTTTTTTVPLAGCGNVLMSGCQPSFPGKGKLLLRNRAPDLKDKLVWKWRSSAVTPVAEFGDPPVTTGFELCVYDDLGMIPGFQAEIGSSAPAGGVCAGTFCWKPKPGKFLYKDKALTPAGMRRLLLKSGAAKKGRIIASGKGAMLVMPATLALTPPIYVQLHRLDGVECWEAVFSNPKKNDATQFKSKSD